MLFKNINYINENFEYIEDVDILTEGNKIKKIGKNIEKNGEEIYNGKEKLAMPGFYNTHCHVPMTLLRGYGEGLALDEWLNTKIFPFEAKLTEEDVYWGSLHGCMELIKSGVCSFTDMYFKLDSIAKAVEQIGMKINICNGISSFDKDEDIEIMSSVIETFDLIEKYDKKDSNVVVDIGLHSEYISHPRLVEYVSKIAKEQGRIVHVHISETEKEHRECIKRHGKTPIEYFEELGLLENRVNAAHCVFVDENDIKIMARRDFTVAHCPSSNMKLGSGFAPIKRFLESGVNVTVGTDGASSNNNLNMLEEITLASLIGKGINNDAKFLNSKEILKIATVNGAKAQGRKNCAAIKEGNKADIVIYDMTSASMRPLTDPLSNIIYSATTENILLNMIEGKVVYSDGKFTNIDEKEVLEKVDKITKRIISQL